MVSLPVAKAQLSQNRRSKLMGDMYRQMLPTLYTLSPNLQALAVTAGYLSPNAMADRTQSRMVPMTTTAGLEGTVAEDFEAFRRELGEGDCIAVVSAAGECVWTSREASSLLDLQKGLNEALKACSVASGGGDVAMDQG